MTSQTVVVQNKTGLHARPASALVAIVKQHQSKITLVCGAKKAIAKSPIQLLTLGIAGGSSVEVQGEGEDEVAAVKAVAEYLATFEDEA